MALVALLLSAVLGAQDARVQRGIDLFVAGEFARARDTLVTLVDAPDLPKAERAVARGYLAAAYHALGDAASARAQLLALARESPEARLAPALFGPDLVSLAEQARTDVAQEPRPPEPIRPLRLPGSPLHSEPEPEPALPPPPLVSSDGAERVSIGVALVPFGVGQFAQGEDAKGTLFLTGEVLALGTSAVALAMFESNKTSGGFLQGGTFRDPRRAQTLQTLHLVAGYTGLALMVGGVVDALVTRAERGGAAGLAGESRAIGLDGEGLWVRF